MQTISKTLGTDFSLDDEKLGNTTALVVDNDLPLYELISEYLARFGIQTTGVRDGAEMRRALAQQTFDVVVIDLILLGEDGPSLCHWLRTTSDVPILILTARNEPIDRIIGLEMGADDYMGKPFDPSELKARIQSVLRRVRY